MTDTDTDTDTDKERGTRKRAHQLPDGWSPDDVTLAKQRKEFPSVDLSRELEKFRNHWQSKGETRKDWLATWRNWIIKADEWSSKAAAKGPTRPPEGEVDYRAGWDQETTA